MQLQAFAKINLDLRVLGRREDGYHEVRTILQTIDWADDIEIDPADRFEFVAHGIEAGEDNLVVKAVRAFEGFTGESVHACIKLSKHIPAGAGLGGGSADAAVTLIGLQRLTGRPMSQQEVRQVLGRLGSDVPFFASGGKALGVGRGDEITAMDDDLEYGLLIVVPPLSIATRDAYSWLTVPDKSNIISRFCAQTVSASGDNGPRNDFESVVFPRYPLLREIQNEILKTGAERAALSGTGSAVFGIFRSVRDATQAASPLLRFGTVKVTRPVSRTEYTRRIWGVAKW